MISVNLASEVFGSQVTHDILENYFSFPQENVYWHAGKTSSTKPTPLSICLRSSLNISTDVKGL
ncbi:hypothetical protein OUZ56_021911 [Daphnia magna]|uniref:Uncharacterized protein n=1 Tax=Daphnia magna TaxID=35525 RepID=A0ABR0AVC3_9CRUS|nr:hypothetical protein OUZ56_021911 [Daphnia magna]